MKKDLEFLAELQKEMKEGEHDYQAFPRFWAIRDYKKVRTSRDDSTEVFYDLDDDEVGPYSYDETVEFIKGMFKEFEGDEEEFSQTSRELFFETFHDEDDLLRWIRNYYLNDTVIVPMKEISFICENTLFLTKEEAQEHLRVNHYHYSDKAHTYAMTALRAPKVERLFKILETCDFDELIKKIEE